MHEIAVCSGLAAAYQLGAEYVTKSIRIKSTLTNIPCRYPFNDDEGAKRMFVLTLLANHGVRMRREDRKGIFF